MLRDTQVIHTVSLIHTHVSPPHYDTHIGYMLSKAHTQSNPHHPWVMNNICLSIPPSLPLAWLLASSWRHCHNVILSASLSPITKMWSDNQAFLHRPLPPHQTGTGSSTSQRPDKMMECLHQGLLGVFPLVQDKTLHDRSSFFTVKI